MLEYGAAGIYGLQGMTSQANHLIDRSVHHDGLAVDEEYITCKALPDASGLRTARPKGNANAIQERSPAGRETTEATEQV